MKLGKAIRLINPSAEFTYDSENYDSIEWLNGTTPISKADIGVVPFSHSIES